MAQGWTPEREGELRLVGFLIDGARSNVETLEGDELSSGFSTISGSVLAPPWYRWEKCITAGLLSTMTVPLQIEF
jgi:hypothetical protein